MPALQPPLPELRQFTDAARPWESRGDGLGQAVYGTREAWIVARREWEAGHGITVAEWFTLACEDALAQGGLAAMNATFSAYLTEDDDGEGDPRLTA